MNRDIFLIGLAMIIAPLILLIFGVFIYGVALIEWTVMSLVVLGIGIYFAIAIIIMIVGLFSSD